MKNLLYKTFRRSLVGAAVFTALTQATLATTTVYSIRVDGLACPYCAYGIEKKLNQLDGIKFIDMDLEKGIVNVESYDIKLGDEQLEQLFQDSGFTYRSKTETEK